MLSHCLPARYELKYALAEEQVEPILDYISPFCRLDPNTPADVGHYTITSLYLDTPTLSLYWAKKDLQFHRWKARVRTYGLCCEGPIFLEIKIRHGDTIAKTRALVPREGWPRLLDEGPEDPSMGDEKGHHAFENFRSRVTMLGLEPVIAVRYDRIAYLGVQEEGPRVTFDRALRFCPAQEMAIPPDDRDYQGVYLPASAFGRETQVILEMKFYGSAPYWMVDLVRRFDLLRSSFSKYCNTVDLLMDDPFFLPGCLHQAQEGW